MNKKLLIAAVGFIIFSGCSSKMPFKINNNEVCDIAIKNHCSSNSHYIIFCYPITNEPKDILRAKAFTDFRGFIAKKLDKFFNYIEKKYNYIVGEKKREKIKEEIGSKILGESEIKESCSFKGHKYFVIIVDKSKLKNELKSMFALSDKQFSEAFSAIFG
jgi:hypothetical protein